jgi:lipopolysaccharide export system protein LptC
MSRMPPAVPHLPTVPLGQRVFGTALAYLPMLAMALLALGSWWLVRLTPIPEGATAAPPPRHEPDYTMRGFVVQRFTPDGTLRTQIEGDVAHHFPDTDTLEIEHPRIRSIAPDGRVTVASAQHALANGDASEVQLLDDAHVVREAVPGDPAIDFRSDFLHVFVNVERVRTNRPVRVTQGDTVVEAAGMAYDNLARVVDLQGRMHGVFVPPPRAR